MKSILYLMNTIWIVMPILVVLMFLLEMELSKKAFTDIARNPKAVLFSMIGQLIVLPVIAFADECDSAYLCFYHTKKINQLWQRKRV